MKEVNYRILIYPNITHRVLQKDSYVDLLPYVISSLNKMRNDLHFTILMPKHIDTLDFPNVEQKILPLPHSPNTMRTHFDSGLIKDLLDWRNCDWDILYSHLPEHTLQLVNIFWNATHHQPKVIGFCHWFETAESMSNRERTMFLQNISGVLQMEEMGVNSQWIKDYIIDKCSEHFNTTTIQKLEKIIQPHHLGINEIDWSNATHPKKEPKKIIFNHRHNSYTGYNWFIGCMDKLWEERKDFRVTTTHGLTERDYTERFTTDIKSEYMDELKKFYIGVGAFKKYNSWSISVTDGFSRGIPYVLPKGLPYEEMIGDDYPLLYENNEEAFLQKMREVLDKPSLRNKARDYIKPKMEDFLWDNRVSNWFNGWDTLFNANDYKCIGTDCGSYKKVIDFISKKKYATKSEVYKMLGWGVSFTFSGIRNALRKDKRIKLTEIGYEWI